MSTGQKKMHDQELIRHRLHNKDKIIELIDDVSVYDDLLDDIIWLWDNKSKIIRNKKLIDLMG